MWGPEARGSSLQKPPRLRGRRPGGFVPGAGECPPSVGRSPGKFWDFRIQKQNAHFEQVFHAFSMGPQTDPTELMRRGDVGVQGSRAQSQRQSACWTLRSKVQEVQRGSVQGVQRSAGEVHVGPRGARVQSPEAR